ncbi:MAG: hypothetical protein JWP19_2233 [Rhodoglobus sp.]|nr:hypothetical protein [Rhodoglobus sp.]
MSLLHPSRTGSAINLWLVDERPVRLVHEGKRYRVTDEPTRLEDDNPELAYRLGFSGWRFQGTDGNDVSHMFEVRRGHGDEWRLLRIYD